MRAVCAHHPDPAEMPVEGDPLAVWRVVRTAAEAVHAALMRPVGAHHPDPPETAKSDSSAVRRNRGRGAIAAVGEAVAMAAIRVHDVDVLPVRDSTEDDPPVRGKRGRAVEETAAGHAVGVRAVCPHDRDVTEPLERDPFAVGGKGRGEIAPTVVREAAPVAALRVRRKDMDGTEAELAFID